MSIQDSPVVAVGAMLPYGTFENGKLFLKMDGLSNGLYVHYDGTWMMVGKIINVEPMRFEVPTITASVSAPTVPEEQQYTIKTGGTY